MRSKLVLTSFIGLILFANNFAQQTIQFSAKDAMFLDELKSVVKSEDGKVFVEFSVDKNSRNEGYKNIDVQKGDEILFINGKRVKTIDEFKKIYGSLADGEEVELGIKRDKDRFFQKFLKADPNNAGGEGGHKIMMKTFVGGDGANKVDVKDGKAVINGKVINIDSLKKAGGTMMMISEPADTTKKVKHD